MNTNIETHLANNIGKDVVGLNQMVNHEVQESDFLAAVDAAPAMQKLFSEIDPSLLLSKELNKFIEVEKEMLGKIICLPTTILMAIRHLKKESKSLTLSEFYELGIYAHTNDLHSENGAIEKGFPSFHRNGLDTYLRYALEFAKINGLGGGIITNFSNLDFIRKVTNNGVVILSVDNLFIPKVMNTDIDPSTFKPSRHAELVHGFSEKNLLISDVTNSRNGTTWNTRNKFVPQTEIEKYLTCPRLNDTFTRAIILTKNDLDWDKITEKIAEDGNIEKPNYNPMLSPFFNKGIDATLKAMRPNSYLD
ncbi:MAG: hypothetical protein UT13_C0001G0819 [Candidatus Pacebacteria bacterium GW2011_GWF2_38_9]|nr:MAG: hypothetical protein US01_C0001G0854 [candidate division TM6 bacterium GW2011_GWF2_28_16]KKQ89171.1 MAG: hypothetical protein UT13_C0001G0819 [Candidatus Pacebacteria bacterium GW2011_GWF2_38_9]